MDSTLSPASYSTTSSGVSESASNSSKSSSSSGILPLFGSPNLQLPTPPRSLFSLTPSPRTGPSSLFSVSPSSNPLPHQVSTPLAVRELGHPSSAGAASVQNQESPNPLSTPPSVRSTTSSQAPAHNTGRYIPLAQRELSITPSPFKTPNSSGATQNRNLDITPVLSSPLAAAPNTIRVLDFDEAVDRTAVKRTRPENEALNEPTIPEPKRTMMPWHIEATQEKAIFRMPTLPKPGHDVMGTDKASSKESSSPATPIAQSSSIVSHSMPQNSNSPFPPLSKSLNTDMRQNVQKTFSPSPSTRPNNLTSIATLSASVSPLLNAPQDSNWIVGEQVRFKSNDPPSPSSSTHSPTSQSNCAISLLPPTANVSTAISTNGTFSKAGSSLMSYSSFSAALAAQALLENTTEDNVSPSELREMFSIETGNLANALEDLVSQVTETSDLVHQLNLHLQMANNEVLLMNSSLVTDERLKTLESFFSNATLTN